MLPQEFIAKWRGNIATEREVCQQSFLDPYTLTGHPTSDTLDPDNQFFIFEAGDTRLACGNGWADGWHKGHRASEYTGQRRSLTSAEAESCFRDRPTVTLESFPIPRPGGHEPHGDLRVQALVAAKDLVVQRDTWLSPFSLVETELKCLTNRCDP